MYNWLLNIDRKKMKQLGIVSKIKKKIIFLNL